jgi:YidC/Oxa1 family membrane protein insertase
VLCLPLYAIAEKWRQIQRDIEEKLKPKIDKIKAVFKGDEQYMILSTYYRQNHYHPIYALRSSFGLLIQIPFFIAAYLYLSHLEALHNASFLFIKDLGAPDYLFQAGGLKVNILPIVMTLVNCLSGAIYAKGLPAKDKLQLYGMAAIFLVLLYNSPSALVLYWTMNNVFSLLKNIYYRIPGKNKRYGLLALFSGLFILLGIFCVLKYGDNSKGQKLIIVSFVTAFLPWIFVIFRKQILKITNIEYEFKKSVLIFLCSLFLIWSVFGLFIPTQLIVSSPQEFSFLDEYSSPLFFVFNTALQVFGFFVFWPVCVYFLFSDNVRKYFSVVFLAISLGIMVNVFLFPGNYGQISINLVFDKGISHTNKEFLINLCILVMPVIVSFLLYMLRNRNIVPILISLCVFSLVSISVLNIYKINSSFKDLKKYYVKVEKESQVVSPLFSFSRNGKNIVVIMIDRAISVFIPFIFDESPELKEIYSGFTYYPNTVSFSGYTRLGSPPIFGGYDYTPKEINIREDIPLVKKHNESLIMLPRILSNNGFSVCVTDLPFANYNWKSDLSIFDDYSAVSAYNTDSQYTDIWLREHGLKLPETGAIIKRNLFWYSLFKGLPLFFRQPLYMHGTWCSPVSNFTLRMTLHGYAVLDYLPRFTEITDLPNNGALIMTNNTTHENSFLQAPDYVPVLHVTNYGKSHFSGASAYHVNAGSIHRLADWFEFLKKEKVYDNTRIILVSDHGPEPNFITKLDLPFNVDQFNPLLMVKDFNSSGEIKTDMTFMSNADVPYLALVDIIDNPINPFTGNAITMELKESPLYIAISSSNETGDGQATKYVLNPHRDYYVHDNIFEAENWTRVSGEK